MEINRVEFKEVGDGIIIIKVLGEKKGGVIVMFYGIVDKDVGLLKIINWLFKIREDFKCF